MEIKKKLVQSPYKDGDAIVSVFGSSGVGAWWNSGGRPQCRPGGDYDADEGARHQGHVQCRSTRQHAVELQTTADGDLCKSCFLLIL